MSPAHESARAPPARPSRGHQPSFSAALLDAIYQSLEADADADADVRSSTETRPAPASSPAQRTPVSSRHGHRATAAVASSPSRSSVRSPRLQRPPRPCRVRPDHSLLLPPPPPPPHEPTGDRADQKKKSSKSSKRNARKTKVAPFACILNALLCNRRPSSRTVDHKPRATAAAFAATEPASARSILSSRASRRESAATGGVLTPARRAVRFSPVAVVVDDGRSGGGGGGAVVGTATRLRDAVEMETMVQAKESAAEAERRVEELLRSLGVAEERERAKESSESSSDLFELESFPAALDAAEPPRPRASAAAARRAAGGAAAQSCMRYSSPS